MKRVLSIILEKDDKIEQIRKKYLPNYEIFEPHINLVYPFEFENQEILKKHISNSLKQFEPFEISLKGLEKSKKDYYLYLLVNEGKEKVIKLHGILNSGILQNFKNLDMPNYIPHLTLGIFKSKEEIEKAVQEISKEKLCFKTRINSIQLLTINEDNSLKSKEDFYF